LEITILVITYSYHLWILISEFGKNDSIAHVVIIDYVNFETIGITGMHKTSLFQLRFSMLYNKSHNSVSRSSQIGCVYFTISASQISIEVCAV